MLSGNDFEKMEAEKLVSYACLALNSKGRKYDIPHSQYRTCFQRDKDRIVHSRAFRRLEYKTQVFVNHEADYYRTRLTHTLEVASISRSLAKSLKVNEDLAESIALAHDIGHTPFGHAGERALHELMENDGGFEHNSQGLRIVEYLEERYAEYPGLNLTYEVREGIIKHHTSYDLPDNKMLKDYEPDLSPTIEAQIVNVADEIAYNSHDIDDGIESGYIEMNDILQVKIFKEIYEQLYDTKKSDKILRYEIVRELIGRQIMDIVLSTFSRIQEKNIKTLLDVRNNPLIVDFSDEMKNKNSELKKFLYENLYRHSKVLKMQYKAERYIKKLFDIYLYDIEQLPKGYAERVKQEGKKRVITDYIAGMTDRFAQDEYIRLFLPYERM